MGFDLTIYKVKARLLSPVLGTTAGSKSIWRDFIEPKQRKELEKAGMTPEQIEEELAATLEGVPETDEMDRGLTTFPSDEKGYYLRDYQVKGVLKNAALAMKEWGKLKQLRAKIGTYCFVRPVRIYLTDGLPELEIVERPLRAQTAQGERICIARSQSIPEGTEFDFEIHTLSDAIEEDLLKELLGYGQYQGLLQNRGAGYGRFEVLTFEEAKPARAAMKKG